MNRLPLLIVILISALLAVGGPTTAPAQNLNLASGASDKPIEIFADNGIEWQQGEEILIASGNARAVRDGVSVTAEVLRAYYRKKAGGGADLYRLDAAGGVKIFSATDTITGRSAVYDFEQAVLVVDGKKVTYRSGNDVITATRQMEYWERKLIAIARGDATATHDGQTLRANTITARFQKDKAGNSKVSEVEAHNNVVIVTQQDRARADRAQYVVATEMAHLIGNVKITRDKNILTGDEAEINLRTGVSRMLRKKKRIRGIIYPTKK